MSRIIMAIFSVILLAMPVLFIHAQDGTSALIDTQAKATPAEVATSTPRATPVSTPTPAPALAPASTVTAEPRAQVPVTTTPETPKNSEVPLIPIAIGAVVLAFGSYVAYMLKIKSKNGNKQNEKKDQSRCFDIKKLMDQKLEEITDLKGQFEDKLKETGKEKVRETLAGTPEGKLLALVEAGEKEYNRLKGLFDQCMLEFGDKNMKLTKFEQSGFIIETGSGYKLAIDIGSYTPVEKLDNLNMDAMLVSHIHGDHFSLEQIKKLAPKKLYLNQECIDALGEESLSSEIIKIKSGENLDIDGIKVKIFEVDHGTNIKLVPKENFGFLIEVDDKKIYFAGDMFYPSGIDVSSLEVDFTLIPVGTFYTFGPEEALSFVKQFKHIGEIIPMHYEKTPETKDKFLALIKDQF